MDPEITPAILPHIPDRKLEIRVIGVGGAGGNMVDHLAARGLGAGDFCALNTDEQALQRLRHCRTAVIGSRITRGLGAGGDPEIGHRAAEEGIDAIRTVVQGADVVFLIAGLGGGTGTGAAPVVARVACESGALVLAIGTLPFDCEGARRRNQALQGIQDLRHASDAVISLPNQRILRMIDENASVVDTLRAIDKFLADGVQGISRMLTRPGIINVDFADLKSVLHGRRAGSAFASVEAQGSQRAVELVDQLLVNPFMDGGQILKDAESVLVSIAGGPDLSMVELNRIMEQINHQCEGAHIILGASIEPELAGRVCLTLVTSQFGPPEPAAETPPNEEIAIPNRLELTPSLAPAELPAKSQPSSPIAEVDTHFFHPPAAVRPPSRFVPPPPPTVSVSAAQQRELARRTAAAASPKSGRAPNRMRQELLPLEIVSKGRFEKSEPTIHRGEDLDVPTYIRRGVSLN